MRTIESINGTAGGLVDSHGADARQIVTDEIADAIKGNDVASAKEWNRVGQEVDRLLAA